MVDDSADSVYFSSNENSTLFRMNLDGSNQTEIYRGEKIGIGLILSTIHFIYWTGIYTTILIYIDLILI